MLGDLEECTGIKIEGSQTSGGKYCLVQIISQNNRDFPTWGTCFPSSCTDRDVSNEMTEFLEELTNGTMIGVVEYCYTGETKTEDTLDSLVM